MCILVLRERDTRPAINILYNNNIFSVACEQTRQYVNIYF